MSNKVGVEHQPAMYYSLPIYLGEKHMVGRFIGHLFCLDAVLQATKFLHLLDLKPAGSFNDGP